MCKLQAECITPVKRKEIKPQACCFCLFQHTLRACGGELREILNFELSWKCHRHLQVKALPLHSHKETKKDYVFTTRGKRLFIIALFLYCYVHHVSEQTSVESVRISWE